MSAKWIRVTRAFHCPVCDHPDWCCVGEKYVNCMRVESSLSCSNGGYLHPIGSKINISYSKPVEEPTIDAEAVMQTISARKWPSMQEKFASSLGVSLPSLAAVGCAWAMAYNAWAFPMKNGFGETVGIRLRTDSGRKFAVKGSRQGIFLPHCDSQSTAYIVEGPTDTAAALTMGLFAIGEPSCNACVNYTQVAINRLGIRKAVIVADNDTVGLRGAKHLSDELQIPCCTLVLPCKDMREFIQLGGNKPLIDSLTSSLVWHHPTNSLSQSHGGSVH